MVPSNHAIVWLVSFELYVGAGNMRQAAWTSVSAVTCAQLVTLSIASRTVDIADHFKGFFRTLSTG